MKIGLFVPLAGPGAEPEFVATLASEAEGHGFDVAEARQPTRGIDALDLAALTPTSHAHVGLGVF